MDSKKYTECGTDPKWKFDNSYLRLPGVFYSSAKPVPVGGAQLLFFNHSLAEEMGLDGGTLDSDHGAEIFAGNGIPVGAEPLAQAYAGHQFGNFTMLGDGRAILLGEHITPQGKRLDVQLKGSGQTPYSRRGDGRAAMGPMLREYIISEAMHALGIPTTRSLAVAATGEMVFRESALPGAVLTRIAASHIRVGTFEYAAARGDLDALKKLADYTRDRHFPETADAARPYLAFLEQVIQRQAALIAQWMLVGFVHGVMNTDNMALSGETIDYGPCAFLDVYDPETVFSSIDRNGRYAYANQPSIAQWNLARLAEAMMPLIDSEEKKAVELAIEALERFTEIYENHWLAGMRRKLGLLNIEKDDRLLAEDLLKWMRKTRADYTQTFRELNPSAAGEKDAEFCSWHERWRARLARQSEPLEKVVECMRQNNPAVIPRNHLVEEALKAAVEREDFSVMERLLAALGKPFEENAENAAYRALPPTCDAPYRTFCGT
jgi:uncharacterized protein YdiU (UPF0061 family)